MDFGSGNLRDIILNLRQPHIIRNMKLPWKCFDVSLLDWCELYDKDLRKQDQTVINFETATRKYCNSPQWERFRCQIPLNIREFYNKAAISDNDNTDEFFKLNWAGFNYKNIQNLPNSCRNGVSFEPFGFSNVDDDITFWLGSEGTHTPCHYDTYGCNIVVQVYGRKMWLLFPPDANLTPIRIPYEESSVYSSEVFYSPCQNEFSTYENISKNCYMCILEPGDVLIVPNKWWHYVQNLSPALSLNCWIPLDNDVNSRLEECIVKFIIENMLQNAKSNKSKIDFLNPNEDLIGEEILLEILKHLTTQKFNNDKELITKKMKSKSYPYQYLSVMEVDKLITKSAIINGKIEKVKNISEQEFYEILKSNNSKNYDENVCSNAASVGGGSLKTILVNALCDPKIIEQVKENFLNRFSKMKR